MPTIVQRYEAQKHRGTNGFGFYVPSKNRLTHNVKERRILSLLGREEESEILFHHRFPTSTANVRSGCHPYSTKDYFENNYVVVHNGVLRNERELKKTHDELGIRYVSLQEDGRFNDSEALAYDVARYLEGHKDTISATGSIAFIAIKRDKGGKPMTLFFARNTSNPLKMKKTKYSLTLSSEGEGELIESNTLYSMSYDTLEITKRTCVIGTGYSSYGRGESWGNYHGPYGWKDMTRVPDPTPVVTVEDNDDSVYEDEEEYEYTQARKNAIKEVRNRFLYQTSYNTASALGLAEDELDALIRRKVELEDMADSEDYEQYIGEDEINEFVGIDENIENTREAIKLLSVKLAEEAIQEERRQESMGFRPPQAITTGKRHIVPTYDGNIKTFSRGAPYSD